MSTCLHFRKAKGWEIECESITQASFWAMRCKGTEKSDNFSFLSRFFLIFICMMKKIGANFKKTSRHADIIFQLVDILIDILILSKSRYRHHTDMSASCRDVNGMLSVCYVFEKRPNVQYSNTLQIHVGMSGCFLQNSLYFFMLLV